MRYLDLPEIFRRSFWNAISRRVCSRVKKSEPLKTCRPAKRRNKFFYWLQYASNSLQILTNMLSNLFIAKMFTSRNVNNLAFALQVMISSKLWTGLDRNDLFDCRARYITTVKDQVIVNRNIKDENSSENRKRFNRLLFSIILCQRLSLMLRSFKTDPKTCHLPMVLMFCLISRAGES